MSEVTTGPQGNPGDIINWPMLKIRYRSDADRVAALLPPGIEPGAEPNVTLTVYNFPVNGMPEYGVVTNVDASFKGIPGEFSLGYGIDQEEAIFISQERNGQPKYPCSIRYYRLLEHVFASCAHQGYTFLDFKGQSVGVEPAGEPFEHNEWWLKYARATGVDEPTGFDFPPHVVRVKTLYQTARKELVQGQLTLNASPWDPIAELLPLRESIENYLWWPQFLSREILVEGTLDAEAFLPHADVIGGSRWPGRNGGPRS